MVQLARASLGLKRLCGRGALLALLLAPVPAFADAGASLLRLDRADVRPEQFAGASSGFGGVAAAGSAGQLARFAPRRVGLRLVSAAPGPARGARGAIRRLRSAAGERRSALCERRLRRPDRRLRQGLARRAKVRLVCSRAVRRSGSDFPRTYSPCARTFCMRAATPSICVCGSKTVREEPYPA